MPSEPPTIVVLHEETLLRQAMVELLAKIMPYRLLTQVADAPALKRAFALGATPDILLMSLECALADHCAILLWVQDRMPGTRVLVTGHQQEPTVVLRTFFAGARGFLCTRQPQEQVCHILQSLLQGACHFPADVLALLRGLLPALEPPPPDKDLHVTPCEREFLRWVLAYGELTYAEIASRMGKEPRTIEKYRYELFKRFGIKGKVGLVHLARQLGLHNEPLPKAKRGKGR